VWSADGSQIAFLTDRTGRWEIWVMNADGSNQHALLSEDAQASLDLQYSNMNERGLSWR
jgi:Tol biopolymer transport system component